MLEVVICEDNSSHRKKIKEIIENTILRENIILKVSLSTKDPEDVIDYVKKNKITGIYFLDVDLKNNMNGIMLGEKIREIDPFGFIIFVTTHMEMSYLAFKYKVEAMDYVIKEDSDFKDRVISCLLKSYHSYYKTENKSDCISINSGARMISVKLCDILFVETIPVSHKIRIHEENSQIEFYGNLKDIEKKLTSNFYRCHKSYIVNVDKIKEIDKKGKKIIMEDEEECYVSFRYMKGLIEKCS